jgi:glycosyltransferase involved in cell wall biosynthesis
MHDVRGDQRPASPRAPGAVAAPVVDIAVPVYNEEQALGPGIERLHAYLMAGFPFSWRITIVDNGSTDGTWLCATRLARDLANVSARHLDGKGRGLALRSAWSASDARVVAYMDVDLSTDLDALLPLIAPLVSGHSDLAIGSRLAPGSSVARAPRRELISRTYNLILRTVLATRVRDAQCGFKAVRADVVNRLLPAVEDNGWFFDTELLLLAEHNGLRIHEVPVDWIDDADSRVHVARTAFDDLLGTLRMAKTFAAGGGQLELGAAARRPLDDDFGRRLVSFAVIGTASTLVSLVLYLLAWGALGAIGANALAVSATFIANTWANARFTVGIRHPRWRTAVALYLGSLAFTSAALLAVDLAGGGFTLQLAVLVVTWMVVAGCRFAVLRAAPRAPQSTS